MPSRPDVAVLRDQQFEVAKHLQRFRPQTERRSDGKGKDGGVQVGFRLLAQTTLPSESARSGHERRRREFPLLAECYRSGPEASMSAVGRYVALNIMAGNGLFWNLAAGLRESTEHCCGLTRGRRR